MSDLPGGTKPGLASPRRKARPAATLLSDLAPRLLSSLVLAAVALGAAWSGGLWFDAFWFAAAAAVLAEWQILVDRAHAMAAIVVGIAALAFAAFLTIRGGLVGALACVIAGGAAASGLAGTGRRWWAGAGVVCAGAMLVALTILRGSDRLGCEAVVWLFAVVWGNDVMAYFGGRLIGGPKLWPRVSPSKTWAGSVVGAVCGAAAGTLWVVVAVTRSVASLWPCFILAVLCAAAAQGGDLFESALKRRFGVKDSSRLIPGHGGVMDRLDGFAAASMLAVLVGVGRNGPAGAAAGLFNW
jgi:phosphatidate cytidylyltransferase